MPIIIYKRQKQILGFIKQYIQSNGTAPTLKQIAEAIGVSSLATVHEHLQALEAKGLITRKSGKMRSIDLAKSDVNLGQPEGFDAPILGFIAAGAPIEPYTDPNATMNIPASFVSGKKRTYVLQVRGESMIEDGIMDGDHVIIEQAEAATNGEIVVALLDNGMATLKRFFRETTRIRLEPANAKMQPIFVKNVRIQGKVVGLVRRYKN
ncbi:MAG: LexA repressor, repressor LexA [Microgenomates group bacterium GW2011_GWC1_43_13]|uniref:LexA repressor n=3 Tax=Candidatus Woeseibacteriota TaxID=1752722 RepID=A0A837I8Q7_9BACT|nr:MAG: LexA repressor, repressor LexA [Microgenomates group bacterium GW2011_GWC1_43_13]KKT32213.1 MAG: LexA repressor [Candidatus Woesebacteria bacterium GW2011_GWB1_44_11]KKT53875.1 MAG: LexA repressor [Candidatus Woesebacteria bacterium GW2011_GWA1_44_23]OGM76201.1 MAG: repressor LexA [Candidatus Woesebacteria bacterium RIFOXYA1_FULL_43_16]OGM84380.1 MAG: repressor LexA [Candidatus Woesebacteria bacterium RIFOXYC1_FULL_43_18]OGM88878.1 MAG: repressor LexA [Candidatus Woesebacteria bacteriu